MVKVTVTFGRLPSTAEFNAAIAGDGPIPAHWPEITRKIAADRRAWRIAAAQGAAA